ncbi:GNAT family N-acetyltransferase [Hydrocarboniclastica marina]|uniref:N-acetyltransferase domain-containing protein n=1 Tax=Hydrocarboniclastica marina TaxID=2259620 RepID=A0A4P7XKL6_9ALTE|nr:hypothetical protein [Hydrocarboniclastica marina]QCF27681.1 hypothetical protein soil367_18090 [Hydrocarboniclastica marina]
MSVNIRAATVDDSPAILRLLANNSQPGKLHLTFERAPDYFYGARVSCKEPDVYVAEHPDGDELVGLFNVGYREVFVNGAVETVRYGHDLRLDQTFRGGSAMLAIYQMLRQVLEGPEWMQSVILADNAHYIKSVGGSRPGLPSFYPCGEIETSLLYGRRSKKVAIGNSEVRPATAEDLPLMQELLDREGPRKQFYPYYRFSALTGTDPFYRGLKPESYWLLFERGRLTGMVGTWDQATFKQTRVVDYSPAIALARPFYNFGSALRGGARLPARGGCFHYLNLHSILIEDNQPERFELLLQDLSSRFTREYDALVCGFFKQDPLVNELARYRRHVLESRHFLTTYGADPRPDLDAGRIPFADIARL